MIFYDIIAWASIKSDAQIQAIKKIIQSIVTIIIDKSMSQSNVNRFKQW